MSAITSYQIELFADYHQFYLCDEMAEGDLSENWTPDAVHRLLALAPGIVGIGTARNMKVPVCIEVWEETPPLELEEWDHVNECSLFIPSGRLVVAGCTDYSSDAIRIDLSPGWYRVRVFYGGLNTLSRNGLEGNDHYRVALWPKEEAGIENLQDWPSCSPE